MAERKTGGREEQRWKRQVIIAMNSPDSRLWNCPRGKVEVVDHYGARWVAFGLGVPGAADCIGIRSKVVTPDMVGRKVGVFLAVEIKSERGRATPEQRRFIEVVNELGGEGHILRPSDGIPR